MSSNAAPENRGGGGCRAGGRKGRGGRQPGRDAGGGGRSSGKNAEAANTKGRGGRVSSEGGRGRSANKNPSGRLGGRNGNKSQQPAPDQREREKQKQEEEDKRRKEAEAERKRLDKIQREAAAKRKKEVAALEERMRIAIDTVKQFVDLKLQRQASRRAMINLTESRKEFESNKKKLKTDLKKCTAFVKKIKSGSAWSNSNIDTNDVVKDVSNLNLSRYVDEIVTAIVESKPKINDLPVTVALCQAMHLRYADFLPNLLRAMWSVINGNNKVDPENTKLRRVYLRIVTQLHLSGLSVDVKPLVRCIADAAGAKDDHYNVQDANLIVAFAKAASPDIFQVTPKSVHDSLEFIIAQLDSKPSSLSVVSGGKKTSDNIPEQAGYYETTSPPPLVVSHTLLEEASKRKELFETIDGGSFHWSPDEEEAHKLLADHCKGAFRVLSDSLVQTHIKLQKLIKRCDQDRLLSGSLTEAREKGLEDARQLKNALQKTVEALADVMTLSVPQLLEEEDSDFELNRTTGVEVWTKGGDDEAGDFGPFDDEETRAFYCDIPDMLATIPPGLLGMTADDIERKAAENAVKYGSPAGNIVSNEDMAVEITSASEAQLDAEEAEAEKGSADRGDVGCVEGEENKDAPHYRLTVLLDQELPECNRREQVDDMSERFCTNHGSSKNSRKRLLKALFLVPRSRLDLLPFYARLTATVDRVWGDIGPTLVTELEQQFHGQTKFKKNLNIDSRMRTARYIGELTKFRVAPPIVFLRCMKRCLDDFTGTNVEIACTLMESSGRFLYRLPHTSSHLSNLMESVTRLSKAKNLDERLQGLVNSALYTMKPPSRGPRKRAKEYPPLESYLRHLFLARLDPSNASCSFVAKQVARLPWYDPAQECGVLVCNLMLKAARKGRYKTIQAIATVAGNLRTQKAAGEATVRLIDAVLEELRWAIEKPNFRDQQRVITYARLLGELCNSSQVSAQVILAQLYDFINVGHEIPESLREASRKLLSEQNHQVEADSLFPAYNSSSGVSQTVREDEEMDEPLIIKTEQEEPETKPVAVSEYSKFDPRVPSAKDPPNSAYRIKLVCTLLEVTAKHLVSRNNLFRLKGFLTAFQRYLFSKLMLPTDVEFSLLDTFDVLDSQWRRLGKVGKFVDTRDTGFPRYATWLEAHHATVAMEESDALYEEQQQATLASGSSQIRDEEDQSVSLEDGDYEEDGSVSSGNETLSDAHESYDHSDSEIEESESEGTTDSVENFENEDVFDEEAHIRQLEEEAFERELRRVTMEALEKGKSSSRKLVADYMPSGSHSIKKKPDGCGRSGQMAESENAAQVPSSGISFQLLKKGSKGKVEAKELIVPMDTNLALVATKQDEAAKERDVIKQRVLQYEAESAESDYAGGNVYLEQEKLQIIRNRPLSMDVIDRNFGTRGGNLRPFDKPAGRATSRPPLSGRGRGRGRSSSSGRTLFG